MLNLNYLNLKTIEIMIQHDETYTAYYETPTSLECESAFNSHTDTSFCVYITTLEIVRKIL